MIHTTMNDVQEAYAAVRCSDLLSFAGQNSSNWLISLPTHLSPSHLIDADPSTVHDELIEKAITKVVSSHGLERAAIEASLEGLSPVQQLLDLRLRSGWQGDLFGSANPETIIVSGDSNVTAVFDPAADTTPPVISATLPD